MKLDLTPTERRLFDLLADGRAHSRTEMVNILDPDGLGEWQTVRVHITHIRAKIKPTGHDILPRMVNRAILYQLVRVYQPEEIVG